MGITPIAFDKNQLDAGTTVSSFLGSLNNNFNNIWVHSYKIAIANANKTATIVKPEEAGQSITIRDGKLSDGDNGDIVILYEDKD